MKSIRLLPARHEMPSNNDLGSIYFQNLFRITCDEVTFQFADRLSTVRERIPMPLACLIHEN